MRYIIVADIHGCQKELFLLLQRISPEDDGSVVIPIGDLYHKGPNQHGVIEYLMGSESYCYEYILGNHEEKQVRWEAHEIKRAQTGKPNPMKHVEGYEFSPPKHREWIRDSARLFLQFQAGDEKFLLVHGGIEPAMKHLPSTNLPWHLPKKEKYRAFNMLRTRYVNPHGQMVPLGEEKDEDVYWAEVYDGRFGHVIFGHQPFLDRSRPKEYPFATGIDLGCVYGNYLCALTIDGDTGEMNYCVVKAADKYADHRKELGSTIPVPE